METEPEEHDEPEYDLLLRGMGLQQLQSMTGGCTELTCMYHGKINAEIRRRKAEMGYYRERGDEPDDHRDSLKPYDGLEQVLTSVVHDWAEDNDQYVDFGVHVHDESCQ